MHHRFFADSNLISGALVALDGEELHHAQRVLRVRKGEEVEIFDGRGHAFAGVVEDLANGISVRLREPAPSRECQQSIALAMAIIQLDRFELVLQKATELGAASIIPIECARGEVRPERYRAKGERWQKIAFEAVKQSGRSVIPTVEPPCRFNDAVARAGIKIVFDADVPPSSSDETSDRLTLFIGPEGGWSEEEIELARAEGCQFRRLGPRRLRAETAAIVALALTARL